MPPPCSTSRSGPARPGRTGRAHAVWPEHGIPRTVLIDVDAGRGARVGAAAPAIVPETIVVDHGKIYVSEHLTSVCARMGISIQPARLRTGRDKGPVERFFRTLREDLLQALPGYKGPDVHLPRAGAGRSTRSSSSTSSKRSSASGSRWCITTGRTRTWSTRTCPGCGCPRRRCSSTAWPGPDTSRCPATRDLAYEFLETEWRTIQHYGVEIDGRRYNGAVLNGVPRQDQPVPGKAKGAWPIHGRPRRRDPGLLPRSGDAHWHALTWEHAAVAGHAASARTRWSSPAGSPPSKYTYPDDRIAVADLLERWNLGLGTTLAERRMALRLSREQTALDSDDSRGTSLPSVRRRCRRSPGVHGDGEDAAAAG